MEERSSSARSEIKNFSGRNSPGCSQLSAKLWFGNEFSEMYSGSRSRSAGEFCTRLLAEFPPPDISRTATSSRGLRKLRDQLIGVFYVLFWPN